MVIRFFYAKLAWTLAAFLHEATALRVNSRSDSNAERERSFISVAGGGLQPAPSIDSSEPVVSAGNRWLNHLLEPSVTVTALTQFIGSLGQVVTSVGVGLPLALTASIDLLNWVKRFAQERIDHSFFEALIQELTAREDTGVVVDSRINLEAKVNSCMRSHQNTTSCPYGPLRAQCTEQKDTELISCLMRSNERQFYCSFYNATYMYEHNCSGETVLGLDDRGRKVSIYNGSFSAKLDLPSWDTMRRALILKDCHNAQELDRAVFLTDINQAVWRETKFLLYNKTEHLKYNHRWRREMMLSQFCFPDTEQRFRKLMEYDRIFGRPEHPPITPTRLIRPRNVNHIRNVAIYALMVPYTFLTKVVPIWLGVKDGNRMVATLNLIERTLDSCKWAIKKVYLMNPRFRNPKARVSHLEPVLQRGLQYASDAVRSLNNSVDNGKSKLERQAFLESGSVELESSTPTSPSTTPVAPGVGMENEASSFGNVGVHSLTSTLRSTTGMTQGVALPNVVSSAEVTKLDSLPPTPPSTTRDRDGQHAAQKAQDLVKATALTDAATVAGKTDSEHKEKGPGISKRTLWFALIIILSILVLVLWIICCMPIRFK
eukprot:gnl/TRDRNA2_/TRDRNA2_178040_c0_seq1.p1 gnl/TRDRNA2_/TRDRNA2_178040_c0~~gnl/TRDRNA2_/TRDRNA2_178040_c0_seq1.p1  ORF type:complete len:601 (-),score=35.73 gnl/TRDRNA2_/TRDRNA2_178040_c0_seq1:346-2148(-)